MENAHMRDSFKLFMQNWLQRTLNPVNDLHSHKYKQDYLTTEDRF